MTQETVVQRSEPLTFARHETFHLRDGWLTKGLQALMDDPTALARPQTNVRAYLVVHPLLADPLTIISRDCGFDSP